MKFSRFLIVASLLATNLGCTEKSKTQASVASDSNATLGQEHFDITNWLAPCDINEWPEHVYEEAGNYLALNLRLVGVAPVLADNGEPPAGVAPHSCHWTWAGLTRVGNLKKPQVEPKSVIRQFFSPCDVEKWTPEMARKETEMYYKQGYELVASTPITTEKEKARSSCYWTFALKNVQ